MGKCSVPGTKISISSESEHGTFVLSTIDVTSQQRTEILQCSHYHTALPLIQLRATEAITTDSRYAVKLADYTSTTNSGLMYENPAKMFGSRFIKNSLSVGEGRRVSQVNWWSKLLTSLGLFCQRRRNPIPYNHWPTWPSAQHKTQRKTRALL